MFYSLQASPVLSIIYKFICLERFLRVILLEKNVEDETTLKLGMTLAIYSSLNSSGFVFYKVLCCLNIYLLL